MVRNSWEWLGDVVSSCEPLHLAFSSWKQLKAVESSWKQLQLAKCSNEQALSVTAVLTVLSQKMTIIVHIENDCYSIMYFHTDDATKNPCPFPRKKSKKTDSCSCLLYTSDAADE